jgi:hypothetical protein
MAAAETEMTSANQSPDALAKDFVSWCRSEGAEVGSLHFEQGLALTLANAQRGTNTQLSLSDPDTAAILTAMGDRVESVTTVFSVGNREHTTIIRFRDPRPDRGEG